MSVSCNLFLYSSNALQSRDFQFPLNTFACRISCTVRRHYGGGVQQPRERWLCAATSQLLVAHWRTKMEEGPTG